jgi:AcrR family transcriptional regulator
MAAHARHTVADKRTRIVESAAKLVYERGFGRTSLADIARESGVPLGNLYYYFKTKDAIGKELIDRMASVYAAAREQWERGATPKERLEAFIHGATETRDALARRGCPVGSLCTELHKDGGPLARRATRLFEDFLKWTEAQFRLMGKGADARDLALQLIAALQGVIVLANSFQDPRLVTRESKRLTEWVRSL